MKKSKPIMISIVLLLILTLPAMSVYAENSKNISKTETFSKSQFLAGEEVNNEGTIKGDLFAGAKTVYSSGVVQGDLITAGNDVSSSGTVTGDILGFAKSIDISGVVGGNIRCGGTNVSISGTVGKNVNVLAETAQIKSNAQIDGNLLALGEYIRVDGKVNGYTKILANRITLNGEFFGDVDINTESFSDKAAVPSRWNSAKHPSAIITILPGTIIHGKLTYQSATRAEIPNGAVVKDSRWIKSKPRVTGNIPSVETMVWSLIKMLLATAVYFLIAMLLLKLFPGIFRHLSDAILHKPLPTVGVGLVGMFSILAALIGLIVLIIVSIFCNAIALAFAVGTILMAFYVVLFYLAVMPVSLALGNLLCKERYMLPTRFVLGLGIISIILFLLNLLSKLPSIGVLFGLIHFVAAFGILLLGIGALLKMARNVIGAVRKYDLGEIESSEIN